MAVQPISAHAARWDLEDAIKAGTADMDLVDAYVGALLHDHAATAEWKRRATNGHGD